MPSSKPHLIYKDGRPVPAPVDPVERARQRFGKPFAHQPGATWQPRKTPYLTEWLQTRGKTA